MIRPDTLHHSGNHRRIASTWLYLRRFLLALPLACLAQATAAFDETNLRDALHEAQARLRAPGLRAAVIRTDGNLVEAAVGLADREKQIPLDTTVGMPGGSTGKPFVAALTMLLVEEGLLALDDSIAERLGPQSWLRRIPDPASITVHHLLSHSSGLGDYPSTGAFNRAMIWRVVRDGSAYFTPDELIGYAARQRIRFPPGEGYRYTDAGYLILGKMIEAAGGSSYYELLDQKILTPLALSHVRPADRAVLDNIAVGYQLASRNLKKDGRMKFDPSSEWTGGGLVTTPAMLAQFFRALAEHEVVSPASFDRMRSAGFRKPGESRPEYGYGLFLGEASISHAGLWPGYRSYVIHQLSSRVTVAVQANRDGRIDLESFARQLLAAAGSSHPER